MALPLAATGYPSGVTIQPEQVLWSAPEHERAGRPLLVLLHGHGMDERMGTELRHRLPPQLVLASIRGPRRVRNGYGWFPLDLTLTYDQIETVANDVLDWASAQRSAPSLGVLGFSQGAAVATQCMRLRPDLFDYGVVLSGFAVPVDAPGDAQLAALRPPVFAGRGAADPMVPAVLAGFTDTWLADHSTLTARTYPGLGHNVSDSELDDLAAFLAERVAADPPPR